MGTNRRLLLLCSVVFQAESNSAADTVSGADYLALVGWIMMN